MDRNGIFVCAILLGALSCVPSFGREIPEMTDEGIGSWAQEPDFRVWISNMPSLADTLARCPYAANIFYLSGDYAAWSARFPEKARVVMEAAMRWQNMDESGQESFFSRHPLLRSNRDK